MGVRVGAAGDRKITTGSGRLETGPYARMGGTTRGRSGTGLRRMGEASIIRDDGGTGRRVARPRRLREFDYSQDGAYSVTICTDWRKHLFGRVTDGRMALNAAGRAVEQVWRGLPEHYPHVELDVFVVMPDHVHGIVVLVGGDSEAGSDSGPALGNVILESRPGEAGYKPGRTQEGRGIGTNAFRPEEAGLKPAPTQEGRGGGGKTRGRLGCCRLCGSTRASERLRPGSPRTGWAEVGRLWSGLVARGGLGALSRWVATGSRPGTPGWRRGWRRGCGRFG